MAHEITRHRLEPKRRSLTVKEKSRITPGMIRIVFAGNDLADFASLAPDDHVKLFIPSQAGQGERRDYTPRRYDPVAHTLTIDFAIHDAGPATRWAIEAEPGDQIEIGGPRGSTVVSPTFDWWLLIGDETALPAIGRRIEEMTERARVISVVSVAGSGGGTNLCHPRAPTRLSGFIGRLITPTIRPHCFRRSRRFRFRREMVLSGSQPRHPSPAPRAITLSIHVPIRSFG